ncbi:MAG: GAF domain-containing protein [Anaerolineaceae bacterium]|nr:GAF domain-containing protein [Anaerolineaceae bacterium]
MSGEFILVIDDSREIVKHLAETVLPSFGYRTLHAYDGQTGLELIREKDPDLVMLDFNLPQMTGLDVLQQMAQESLKTPVVLMTGYGSELSAIEAFRLGAKDYIIKPFTVDEIVETIDRALAETRLLHDKAELAEQIRRLKVEMSRQSNEMRTLSNIGKAITTLLSVDEVLQRVLEAATYLTNAEESTIWLPDDEGKHLRPYDRQTQLHTNNKGPILPLADSPAGEVMQSGRPLRHSSMAGQGMKVKTGYYARAVLYVPLQLRGINLGVLGVSNRSAYRAFSKQDEFLLSFLADFAAISLENARVFQAADQALAARLEELNTLIHITQTITASLDLQEVIHLTIQQVHDSWEIEASSLWLLNEASQTLRVLTNVGTAVEMVEKLELTLKQGIVGKVVRTGKPIYTNDVAHHEDHFHQADVQTGFKTRSLLCVPLIFRGKVVGAMQLLNKIDGDFHEGDLERARAIAAAIAIAVSNALLFDEAETRKQAMEQAKSHFLTSLAEDLNKPLHQLSDMASQLGETGPLNREQARLSRHILQASDQMRQLLSGLIDLALGNGRSAPSQQPCDLLSIVTDVVQSLQPEADAKNVSVQLTADSNQYQVIGDPAQLHHAVSCLVENAVKQSPPEEKVQITLEAQPEHVLLQVHDRRPGITQSSFPHVSPKSYREQAPDETNSGLGLALTQSIADLHGGQLWAESRVNQGSTFYLELPLGQTTPS